MSSLMRRLVAVVALLVGMAIPRTVEAQWGASPSALWARSNAIGAGVYLDVPQAGFALGPFTVRFRARADVELLPGAATKAGIVERWDASGGFFFYEDANGNVVDPEAARDGIGDLRGSYGTLVLVDWWRLRVGGGLACDPNVGPVTCHPGQLAATALAGFALTHKTWAVLEFPEIASTVSRFRVRIEVDF